MKEAGGRQGGVSGQRVVLGFRRIFKQNENEVPGARGYRVILSRFAYVYGVLSDIKCSKGLSP